MQKTFNLIAISSLALALSGCSWFSSTGEIQTQNESLANQIAPIASLEVAESRQLNQENSSIKWRGEVVTGLKGHEGTIPVSGFVGFNSSKELVAGTFELDISNLTNSDLEGEIQETLLDHLKSEDFFDTESYPSANLNITSSEKLDENIYSLTADLTIKDQTNSIQFKAEVDGTEIRSQFDIDRTRWGVTYGSGNFFDNLKDSAIKDEIMFDIKLSI
ncbi:YceI family protein [bacterium]|jgi:hypothetical protein|nr:YceI family protein [bacterium]MBT6293765.1 YceI family protein [bacterium]